MGKNVVNIIVRAIYVWLKPIRVVLLAGLWLLLHELEHDWAVIVRRNPS